MSVLNYHESITNELLAVAKRVREFVTHWGEDGRHHEAVLKSVIRKIIPKRFELGSGFVIKPTQERGNHKVSKQIDIIIYDTNFPTFFKEGDFVILTPDAVRGIISVKANLENQNRQSVYDDCNYNGKFIFTGKQESKNSVLFNGLFSFDGFHREEVDFSSLTNKLQNSFEEYKDHNWVQEYLNTPCEEWRYILNHISCSKNYFIKHWNSNIVGEQNYSIYKLPHLSYSFFISNLINYLTFEEYTVEHDKNIWYPEDKRNRIIEKFGLRRNSDNQ